MDFLELDIVGGTFLFVPRIDPLDPRKEQRAEYTKKLVGLNSRAGLPEARRHAFVHFRSDLESYDRTKNAGGQNRKLDELRETIMTAGHRLHRIKTRHFAYFGGLPPGSVRLPMEVLAGSPPGKNPKPAPTGCPKRECLAAEAQSFPPWVLRSEEIAHFKKSGHRCSQLPRLHPYR